MHINMFHVNQIKRPAWVETIFYLFVITLLRRLRGFELLTKYELFEQEM